MPGYEADDLIGLIKKYKIEKQILGLVSGNHPESVLKHYGTDIHQYMCNQLKVRNFGYSFAFVMSFIYKSKNNNSINFTMMLLLPPFCFCMKQSEIGRASCRERV